MFEPVLDASTRDYKDAIRLAVQSAIAGSLMYALLKVFNMPEEFVGVLTAVLIVEPSLGSTIGRGKTRLLATLVGCIVGVASMWLLPSGYGTTAAIALTMLIMNSIAGFWPEWRYGVVAAVALALGSEQDALQTAMDRSLSIGLGMMVGIAVSLIVWPDKSSDRAMRTLDDAINNIRDYVERITDDAIDDAKDAEQDSEIDDAPTILRRYQKNIEQARNLAKDVRLADNDPLWSRIRVTEKLYIIISMLGPMSDDLKEASEADGSLNAIVGEAGDALVETLDTLSDRKPASDKQHGKLSDIIDKLGDGSAFEDDSVVTRHTLLFVLSDLRALLNEIDD